MENAVEVEAVQVAPEDDFRPVRPSPVLYKFTNREQSPELDSLLAMFYQAVYTNTLGIMQAWNIAKDEEELILVGVQLDENGKTDLYPIATTLRAEDVPNYLAPNGKGGFYDPQNPTELAEAKEDMKPAAEAIVD